MEMFLLKMYILVFLYINIDSNIKNFYFKFLLIFGGDKQTKHKAEKLVKERTRENTGPALEWHVSPTIAFPNGLRSKYTVRHARLLKC